MKWIGLVVTLLGAGLLKACWEDAVEGKILRPVAVLIIAGGAIVFFEGLKREIIAGVRQKDKESKGT